MLQKYRIACGLLLAVSLGGLSVGAQAAATCAGGTLTGASVCTVSGANFDVVYNLGDVGLYGDANIFGNTIVFFPDSTFTTTSQNGAGGTNVNSAVEFDIFATAVGFEIEQLILQEQGQYQLDGANSSVNHTGAVSAFDTNNFTFFNENINETAPLNINDNQIHNWAATALLDFSPGFFGVTHVADIAITNSLSAATIDPISLAMINKLISQQPVVLGVNENPGAASVVPVPAAVWLFGSGLLGLFGVARHRRLS